MKSRPILTAALLIVGLLVTVRGIGPRAAAPQAVTARPGIVPPNMATTRDDVRGTLTTTAAARAANDPARRAVHPNFDLAVGNDLIRANPLDTVLPPATPVARASNSASWEVQIVCAGDVRFAHTLRSTDGVRVITRKTR